MTICEHCNAIDEGTIEIEMNDHIVEICGKCKEFDVVSSIEHNDWLDNLEADRNDDTF